MQISVGIIGIGNVGSAHATAIYGGKISGMKLAAICDISPERKEWARVNCPDAEFFETAEEFFDCAKIDTVIIATPHYFHTVYAIEGFKRGLNVLTEKPAGVRVSDVIKMNEAAEKSGKVFAIMWNQRTNPMYREVRRIIKEGILGKPQRLLWEATAWYRNQEYYDSGSWRATWLGEGGGVLMNQAPHQLDLMQWIFGMPDYVRADCYVGK
ncbi:MAG: Gfo/Idh/MocA family oxidoreductase [Clostridiales bacterium]|nr:Gfo/Idh/MocA family oxidoreductase [Candidatus Equinaster intestinalis]